MSRYSKYFLEHILWLEDDFCQYYLHDDYSWGRKDILDVQSLIFFWPEEAGQWLAQCAHYDYFITLRRLRTFLAESLEQYPVYRMNDRQVLATAARQICRSALQLVIHPKIGWAVQVDPQTDEPVQPIAVEAEPELAPLLAELKQHLDALVAEQQKKYDHYEAQLAKMSPEQKALLYSKKAGGAVYDSTVGGALDMVKAAPGAIWRAARAFPGFYGAHLKMLWKMAQTPAKMAALTAHSLATGDFNPLNEELDRIVTPVTNGYEQAMKYKSMLTVILSDQETYDLLYDFGRRYRDATHPIELTEMGASAVADIVVTVILAIVTAGVGAAANVAAKSGRLAKAAELLEKIAATIRRVGHRTKLIGKTEDAVKTGKTERRAAKTAHEIKEAEADIKHAKQAEKIEKKVQKDYDAAKEIDGTKKTVDSGSKGTVGETKAKLTKPQIDEVVEKTGKSIKNHPLRKEYEDAVAGLKDMEIELKRDGLSEESIAKQLHQARRDLGVKYKNLTPKELREYIYEINKNRYGDELGPTFDYLRNVKKKSYAEIIESAQRPNPDVDKLLGGFKKWLLTKSGY